MTGWTEVRLEHDQSALDGLLTFDGEVVEVFGFNDVHSVRMPLRLIEGVELSFDKGMIATPHITFQGRNGGLGYTKAIDPRDEVKPALEHFAELVSAAAAKTGGAS